MAWQYCDVTRCHYVLRGHINLYFLLFPNCKDKLIFIFLIKFQVPDGQSHQCSLLMKHRHNSQNGASNDTPDCSADMHEFKTSLVLTSFYSILINLAIVIICFQFDDEKDEKFWQLGLIIQVISCVFHPLIEFLLSAKVRYFIKDRIESFSGGITSDTVIVT